MPRGRLGRLPTESNLPPRPMSDLLRFCLAAIATILACSSSAAPVESKWHDGPGSWTDGSRWSAGLPNELEEASVGGRSRVAIPAGHYSAAMLKIGCKSGDRAQLELDGGELLIRQDSLIVGEYTNSEGTFILNDGTMQSVMDIFVGAATGSVGRKS